MQAWSNSIVPNFVTTNSFVAKAYAKLLVDWCLDLASNDHLRWAEPIYIVDVGAGPGKLAHLILIELQELWPFTADLIDTDTSFPWVYVVTDVSEGCLKAYEQNPVLAGHMKCGRLDIGVFDAEHDTKVCQH